MSRGSTPRHAQTAGDLSFAAQFNDETRGISRSSAILGSDSPQSNNRKDHSLWVTPFIPRERPNVKHAIAGYLRLPRPTSAPALMRVLQLYGHVHILWTYQQIKERKHNFGFWMIFGLIVSFNKTASINIISIQIVQ